MGIALEELGLTGKIPYRFDKLSESGVLAALMVAMMASSLWESCLGS